MEDQSARDASSERAYRRGYHHGVEEPTSGRTRTVYMVNPAIQRTKP